MMMHQTPCHRSGTAHHKYIRNSNCSRNGGSSLMSAIFELPIESETLTTEEIVQITGCQRRTDQVEWLTCNGWAFHKNKIGDPIVGRFFARLKMAGIRLDSVAPSTGMPDFSK